MNPEVQESEAQPVKTKRVAHYLEPIKTPPKEKPFCVFDIESKEEDTQNAGFTRPFMVGFYDGKQFISFRNDPQRVAKYPWYERCISPGGCIDKLMRHLLGNDPREMSPYADFDLYAHNMGSFDGLFLPAWLERNNHWISYKVMPVQSRIQCIEIWKYNKNRFRGNQDAQKNANKKDRQQFGVIRILDSFRIMPSSLDKIAKAFGLEGKLKDMNLHTEESDPLWEKYNEIDCEQLYQVRKKYGEMIASLGGEVGITAPSAAVKLLRRKYLPEDLRIQRNIHFENCAAEDSCEGCAHAYFRSAYFGGRTEIYNRKGTGWYYDVNSSYPFSMTKPQPVGDMIELGQNEDFSRFANDENYYVGFVRCTVDISEDTYLPPLPVQHGGKLKFPAGRFSGTWDWTELKTFRILGAKILHVEKSVWIRSNRFLVAYVNDLYAMRKKDSPQYKGPALSEVAKIMLNSTFGKFGMDPNRIEMLILKPGEDEPWEVRYPGESEDHREKRKRAAKEGDHSFKITIPLPGESEDHFEERRKAERKGVHVSPWRVPELSTVSGIYEHDSLVRIRDIKVDAAYIIPQIAAHITANSRALLWEFAMTILDQCQTCQTCNIDYIDHFVCSRCGFLLTEHFPREDDVMKSEPSCQEFTPHCSDFKACKRPRQGHDEAYSCKNFSPHLVYYSDTDSILSSYDGFPDVKELGGLKKEYLEPITIECFAPKMYRLSKATYFDGQHVRGGRKCKEGCTGCKKDVRGKPIEGEHETGKKRCLQLCPGCAKGKPGEHTLNEKGERDCEKKCPGCSREKIMMKGVPADMRTLDTIEKLLVRREEVSYTQHEKLGMLAKKGFRETPRMQEIKKSIKSKYDKRIMSEHDGRTKPIVLNSPEFQSLAYKNAIASGKYKTPQWLVNIVAPK